MNIDELAMYTIICIYAGAIISLS